MKSCKITLSGLAGSGKSTVGKLLAEKLNCPFLSMGNFSREYALRHYNAGINEFQLICKQQPEIDFELDKAFIERCKKSESAVIDYRLGFHFIPDAFSVFLSVSDEVASKRITLSGRENESPETIRERNRAMRERFLETYKVDFTDLRHYQLVIDTDNLLPDQIANQVIDFEIA